MHLSNQQIKDLLSKINFAINRNPRIERNPDWNRFIPKGFKAVVLITADFELAWAPRYSKVYKNPLKQALNLASTERMNIPTILKLCETYSIPITWATIGHLFLHGCKPIEDNIHPSIPAVPAYTGKYWDFAGEDWFKHDPCTDLQTDPLWYAPDLIKSIISSSVQHEIGCHTFSHIDCRDEVCPPELFESELKECIFEARKLDLELRSFVHPGHTIGNLESLANLQFKSYQSDPGNILGYPVKHKSSLWEIKRTYELVYRPSWSIPYHLKRYKTIIRRAIKNNAVCNLWFHPSVDPVFVTDILPGIFNFLRENKKSIWISTVGEYVDYLNHSNG